MKLNRNNSLLGSVVLMIKIFLSSKAPVVSILSMPISTPPVNWANPRFLSAQSVRLGRLNGPNTFQSSIADASAERLDPTRGLVSNLKTRYIKTKLTYFRGQMRSY
jgi:hypothetical protein